MGTVWEYFVDTVESGFMSSGAVDSKAMAARLNWYGGQGWELIHSYTTTFANGGTHFQVFIYKRERPAGSASPPAPGA